MGWTFPYATKTRSDLVRYLRRPERFGTRVELMRACVINSHHWYLVRDRESGMHWIGLDLLQGGGKSGQGWGYKDLDETAGPCAHDCPLSYLMAPHAPREGWALQWRERVRAYHADRKARPALVAGLCVRFGERVYALLEPIGPRRGWRVRDIDTGDTYRMPALYLARAERLHNRTLPSPAIEPGFLLACTIG